MIPRRCLLLTLVGALLVVAPAAAHVGTGILVDAQGRIYFTDTIRDRIWRLDPDGRLTSLAADIHADQFVLAPDGHLYVLEESIWKINPQGEKTALPGAETPATPLTMDPEGNLYLARQDCAVWRSSGLLKRTSAGAVSLLAGGAWGQADGQGSDARFTCLNGAAWGLDAALYLRDAQLIRRVTPDGRVTTLPRSAEAAAAENGNLALVRTMGLAADARGNVYVANYWQRAVFKLTPDGHLATVFRSSWPWVPTGVTTAGGSVYVLERLGNPYGPTAFLSAGWLGDSISNLRVRKIAPDGAVTTLVTIGRQP